MDLESWFARLEHLEELAGVTEKKPEPTPAIAGMDDLLAQAKTLPPEVKLQLIKAMGFIATGDDHDGECIGRPGSGYVCNCVPPATWWHAPNDVDVYRKETWEDRLALANEWTRKGTHGRKR